MYFKACATRFSGPAHSATLEIPKALVAAEADRMVQAAIEEMKSRGGKEADAQLSPSTFEPQLPIALRWA